jgi:hypothetical protein
MSMQSEIVLNLSNLFYSEIPGWSPWTVVENAPSKVPSASTEAIVDQCLGHFDRQARVVSVQARRSVGVRWTRVCSGVFQPPMESQ